MNEWIFDNGQNVLQFSSQTERSSSPSYFQIFSLSYSAKRPLLEIIILWNYTITIILCITKNNAVINRNYGRLQDLILLFKIPMGTRKNFLEVWQFGHVPSKTFASSALDAAAPRGGIVAYRNSEHAPKTAKMKKFNNLRNQAALRFNIQNLAVYHQAESS